MAILNSLPKGIGVATEKTNGLMSSDDKIAVNKINRIEADVANKMNRDEKIKSSQLDTSNDNVKIQPENLSSAVKEMMTGQTPISPEIAFKSLITEYYADSSVTFAKRTPVGSIAVIVSEDFCNFDTTGDTEVVLSIPKTYSVYFGPDKKDYINTPESLTMEKGVPSVIAYNKLEGFTAYDTYAVKEQDFIVGMFDGTNVTMFNGRYTVNGSVVVGDKSLDGSALKDFSVDSKKLAIQHGTILSNKVDGPYLNVNFTSKFIEVVKEFDVNIADQYVKTIKASQECSIPDNTTNKKYLYIYYDLGINKLNALWSLNDITKSILNNNEKLVLLGIIYDQKDTVGINSEFISVKSLSTKNKIIEYTDILSGRIIIDFENKKIEANNVRAFVNNSLISLLESDTQTITLSDDIITNITNSGVPYTLAAVRVDFDSADYRLVFDKTENIKYIGLDAIILTSVKNYTLSHNKENIIIINTNGNTVKSNNNISLGYTLPIDDTTVVVNLTTEIDEGNLTLVSSTVPGTSVVDPMTNTKYDIKTQTQFKTIIENLHGLYSVLYNTESGNIEIVPQTNNIDSKIYISLGYVQELSDSTAYTALGNITNHIMLNNKRPSNYAIITGPDPDKDYDWSNNRLVLPRDIYLLSNASYTFYCQNMSMNSYVDNDYINYEIALPSNAVLTENVFNINSGFGIGTYETRIVGKFKGNNNSLFKDVNLHFGVPESKEITVLCIGDDTVDMNMPAYIKTYLTNLGYTPTMLGTTKNSINTNGYGLKDLPEEYGEGHKGWRLTDFMCKTRHRDGSPYYIPNNPFMNNSKFDFSNYMTTNSYDKVDAVVISVGLNDITGYHTASAIEDIENLTIYQNIEQLPNIYKEMIDNIHKFDSNIKILINPTMIKGIDDDFNRKSLMLNEVLFHELKDLPNTFFVPGYLGQPMFAGANSSSTADYTVSSDINNTKLGPIVNSSEINGMAQSILAYMITSAIAVVCK